MRNIFLFLYKFIGSSNISFVNFLHRYTNIVIVPLVGDSIGISLKKMESIDKNLVTGYKDMAYYNKQWANDTKLTSTVRSSLKQISNNFVSLAKMYLQLAVQCSQQAAFFNSEFQPDGQLSIS